MLIISNTSKVLKFASNLISISFCVSAVMLPFLQQTSLSGRSSVKTRLFRRNSNFAALSQAELYMAIVRWISTRFKKKKYKKKGVWGKGFQALCPMSQ